MTTNIKILAAFIAFLVGFQLHKLVLADPPKTPVHATPVIPPHASFPMGVGQPIEKLPNKLNEVDAKELQILQLQTQVDTLTAQLTSCHNRLAQVSKRDRDARKKALINRYKLNEGDIVNDDGTIERTK